MYKEKDFCPFYHQSTHGDLHNENVEGEVRAEGEPGYEAIGSIGHSLG